MAAGNWKAYNEGKKYLLTADLDLDSTLVRIKLVKGGGASTVSNFATSTFASAGSGQAPSNMKTPHPKSLTGITVTAGASAKVIRFDTPNNPVFSVSGGNATSVQYAVIGISGGKALGWCKLTDTPATITSTLTITLNASGIFELSGAVT